MVKCGAGEGMGEELPGSGYHGWSGVEDLITLTIITLFVSIQ